MDEKILSKDNDISHDESLKIINHSRTLILPKEVEEERRHTCGACGKRMTKSDQTEFYFGEKFHAKCAYAMMRGEKCD